MWVRVCAWEGVPHSRYSGSILQHIVRFALSQVRPFASSGRGGALHVDGVALDALAKKYGTPLYVYSATHIQERFDLYERAFASVPHLICYAVKANSALAILALLDKRGAGFDIVSGGELERVLTVNRKAAGRVVFSGVGKTAP